MKCPICGNYVAPEHRCSFCTNRDLKTNTTRTESGIVWDYRYTVPGVLWNTFPAALAAFNWAEAKR